MTPWSIKCRECGAPAGKPCTAIKTGGSYKRGAPIKYYHVKRVLDAKSAPTDGTAKP